MPLLLSLCTPSIPSLITLHTYQIPNPIHYCLRCAFALEPSQTMPSVSPSELVGSMAFCHHALPSDSLSVSLCPNSPTIGSLSRDYIYVFLLFTLHFIYILNGIDPIVSDRIKILLLKILYLQRNKDESKSYPQFYHT